eukprot:9750628-Alexandrium_andersonii.AAC.1
MRAQLAFAMLDMLVQFVRRSRIARGRADGVHSCTVARSCPSARALGADGAIDEHCAARMSSCTQDACATRLRYARRVGAIRASESHCA